MLSALWQYKAYIIRNAVGELKYRYAGSTIGFIWHILNPLLQIVVYTVVFSTIMSAKLPGIDGMGGFSLYLCAGMFAWLSFQEILTRGTNTFQESSAFLKKLPVPEVVFVAQKVLSSFFSCSINYGIIFVYATLLLKTLTPFWLLVPLVLVLFSLAGFGLAMFLGALNVFFKDLSQIIGIILMVWMWLTPIVYVKEILPDTLLGTVKLNPVYHFIEALHQVIVYQQAPSPTSWVVMFTFAALCIVIGWYTLKKLSKEIRDLL